MELINLFVAENGEALLSLLSALVLSIITFLANEVRTYLRRQAWVAEEGLAILAINEAERRLKEAAESGLRKYAAKIGMTPTELKSSKSDHTDAIDEAVHYVMRTGAPDSVQILGPNKTPLMPSAIWDVVQSRIPFLDD